MQRKIRNLLIICSLAMLSLALTPRLNANPDTIIHISPASTTAVLNNDYVVYVSITDVNNLYGWEFQLDYNDTILELTSSDLVSGGLNTPTNTYQNVTEAGHLWLAVSSLYPALGITYGEHEIVEIHFHTILTGNAALDLHDTTLVNGDANEITHTAVDGTVDVYGRDLTVSSVTVLDLGCSIYEADTDNNSLLYYVPIEVTVLNTGTLDAGAFYVKLETNWIEGSDDVSQEILVTSLDDGAATTVNFTSLFHPLHHGHYQLSATVDSRNEISEENEANNSLVPSEFEVTIIGDANGDHVVNILDGVILSLAWGAKPTDGWWRIKADLDHNGVINILDGYRASFHWGEYW